MIRKGKKHYVCDTRLRTYESSIKNLDRELDQKLLIELKRLTGENENLLDLDNAILTPYVKGRIDGWFRMQNVKVFGYDYDDFVETDEHTCLMLTRRKWSFRKFVKSIILKVKGMW